MTDASWKSRITLDPEILAGKPIIKGTRITVEFILDLLANGWTDEGIIENYPQSRKRTYGQPLVMRLIS